MSEAGGPREPAPAPDPDGAAAPAAPAAVDLSVTPDGFVVPGTGLEPIPRRRRRLRDSRLFVCLMLFVVLGPFALPLLWRGRAFRAWWKVALTVATLLYTAALVIETVRLVPQFVEWGRQLGECFQPR